MALEGPPRLPLRRLDGLHARHAGEPRGVPPGLQPDGRDQLRHRPDRGRHLAVVRRDPRPGRLPLRGQGARRGQPATAALGRAVPRRRAAGGPPDVGLGRHAPAQGAGRRYRQPALGPPPGRLPQGDPPGKDDHLVVWRKPTSIRSVDRRTYNALPDSITVRETRFRVEQPGFRTRSVVVVTTLLDPEQASREDLASLYRARWNNELDLRSIKVTLQMDMLRCRTPGLVRKEIWAHVLAYNLVRTVMAQAAAREEVAPRSVSFKATLQVLEAFRPLIDHQADHGAGHRAVLCEQVLRAIAAHRVADRPDRYEPRMAKRRPEKYDRLTRPRAEIKRAMARGAQK